MNWLLSVFELANDITVVDLFQAVAIGYMLCKYGIVKSILSFIVIYLLITSLPELLPETPQLLKALF